jgi:hypothetical protein
MLGHLSETEIYRQPRAHEQEWRITVSRAHRGRGLGLRDWEPMISSDVDPEDRPIRHRYKNG